MRTQKPHRGNRRGFVKAETAAVDCLISITKPLKPQLFGRFDHDTKNAVIITAREVV